MITVTDAGTARLATAAELQAVVAGLSEAQANALIETATLQIQAHCSRVLHLRSLVQTLRPCVGAHRLMLDQHPLVAMASIVENGETLTGTDYEVDGSFVYRLSDDVRTVWPAGKIVLTYTAGYTDETCPADLKRACLDIAVNLNAMEGRDQTIRSINVPDVEVVSYRDIANGGGAVPESAIAVLNAYKEWWP